MLSPSDARTPRLPRFIALEGMDKSGKSTQARMLSRTFRQQEIPAVLTREPGGTPLGERLRGIILDPSITCAPRAELLMLLAARAQHIAEIITPNLAEGNIVISDRFTLSTLAYQGYGRGLPLDAIRTANEVATGGVKPDVTLLIDISYDCYRARVGERRDRFEGEGETFLRRVIDGYRQLAADDASIIVIDGEASIGEVHQHILRAIQWREETTNETHHRSHS